MQSVPSTPFRFGLLLQSIDSIGHLGAKYSKQRASRKALWFS
jgi:hypothetical protein